MFRSIVLAAAALVVVSLSVPTRAQEVTGVDPHNKPLCSNSTDRKLRRSEKIDSQLRACTNIDQCSFVENFKTKDLDRWLPADKWANGKSFAAWWSKRRIFFNKKKKRMEIKVGNTPGYGKPYVSGQLQSTKWHGYGCYEVRMRPGNQEGLVTTFFTYTGEYDAAPGKPKKHNEVDIEFVYKRKYKKIMLQANYFTNGRGNHEHLIRLPFDVTKKLNNYAFKWTSRKIIWYVNGKKVYVTKTDIPQIQKGPHKIMMSLWPVSSYSAKWAGYYRWKGPTSATYAAMRFTRGEGCKIHNWF